jgi:SAM-dependent methyltransferase
MPGRTEPRGEELVRRYKLNYAIPADATITEDMVLHHWNLEKRLRIQLLESSPSNRRQVFRQCYGTLYAELDWLNRVVPNLYTKRRIYEDWVSIIGDPPKKIYEVGSGKGDFISYLAERGFQCRGTEITHERGEKLVLPHVNVSWGFSDGVHLDQFEPRDTYDAVISDQLVEHLHPDDLADHFHGVLSILAPAGRYVFATPHSAYGPSDISRVFNCDRPKGMHLCEYTYRQIEHSLKAAGFVRVYVPFKLPHQMRRLLGGRPKPRASRAYLGYLCIVERLIALLPTQELRKKAARALKVIGFWGIMIIAEKQAVRDYV